METIQGWLEFLGWGKPHLMAILYAAGLSTVFAQVVKYPVRLFTDSRKWSVKTFAYIVRTIAGAGAFIGAALTWPERGRFAFLGGALAWVIVHWLYALTAPLFARFFPWISADRVSKLKVVPDEDGQDSGV